MHTCKWAILIYQYFNMDPRLLGQNCRVFKFLLSLNSQKRLDTKETTTTTTPTRATTTTTTTTKKVRNTYPNTASHPLQAKNTKTRNWMARITPSTITMVKAAEMKKTFFLKKILRKRNSWSAHYWPTVSFNIWNTNTLRQQRSRGNWEARHRYIQVDAYANSSYWSPQIGEFHSMSRISGGSWLSFFTKIRGEGAGPPGPSPRLATVNLLYSCDYFRFSLWFTVDFKLIFWG